MQRARHTNTHIPAINCVQRAAVALSEKLCKPQNESEIENEIEEDDRPEIYRDYMHIHIYK